jgi:predicted ArsR family transcriptional regulator
MDDELGRESETRSDFRLARLATVQGNARPQEFRTRRPVNCPIDTAATQQGAVCRIHNGIHRKLGDVALDNFNLNHKNLQEKYK